MKLQQLPDVDGEHSREWWRLLTIALAKHPHVYPRRTHHMRGRPMTPDSAWRQYRGAVRDLNTAQNREQQARATWLQTLIEQFEDRRTAADEKGIDVTDPKNLLALGLPCKDCLKIAVPRTGHKVVITGAGHTFHAYAECGMAAIDPTKEQMPESPTPRIVATT